jgi:hypothetical protein
MDYQKLIESMTPDIYQRLKQALELGKWPDGKALDAEQKQICMEAIINWESRHLSAEQRTGYIDRGSKAAGETCGDEQILNLKDTLH